MHSVPLTPLDPPRNFPRLAFTCLPFAPGLGSVTIFQSASVSKFWDLSWSDYVLRIRKIAYHPPAMMVFSSRELCCPASMSRTEVFGSSARRAARTEPEVPPLHFIRQVAWRTLEIRTRRRYSRTVSLQARSWYWNSSWSFCNQVKLALVIWSVLLVKLFRSKRVRKSRTMTSRVRLRYIVHWGRSTLLSKLTQVV